MSAPDLALPDDVDALKAMVIAMAEKAALLEERNVHLELVNKSAEERIARLTATVKMLERSRFGSRSERLRTGALSEEQYALVFDEIETGVAAIEAQMEKAAGGLKAKRAPRPRKGFAAHLERVEVVIEPETPAGCAGLERILIGEDVSERLDVTPAKFRVIVTRRPKYAYKGWDGVIQAAAPARIIESGTPTEALLAQIAVSKYADGLPLYRQEAIYARDQVEIDRSQMAQWMGKVGFELEPLADYALARIKQGERVFADETTLPTLAPGSGKAKTAYLWTYVRDDRPFGGSGPPIVAYRFEDSRAGECVARHLEGYCGILQVDGYAAYNRLAKPDRANDGMTLAGCWSHVRRKFYELHVAGSSVIASQTVAQMTPLWATEEAVRGQDPAVRVTARQEKSAAIVAALFALWEKELPKLSGKSKPAEAIRYALGRRAVLERFLADGRIELDSNTVERAIRPQTITRKNSLFAGSDGGGRTWATIATLLATAKMNQVDPHAWLTQTLERIANGWPNSDIEALLPWNYPR
ncbi:IS66 family transposase [Mesorhizobium sp.]|uniref:IS66 family transposase n=1 Tax=Mesorhizobium sp. TaxID=1871066 RepID=UPI000FE93B9A|nr:IS66 family transposase [Mesorhizobium sp.]RWN51562.1 MAG: IS66 family transposase [Mesorhizobium sp.]RWN73605.1 MAG: IS66 family transposase [Mesorhizobium sp.]RWN75827.1 MAG: IS66 family transposase [Mesorhizobium sp.]RWO09548.1 MAG: IS66 family transposase [Mesorhizobium sp.]TIN99375.1 MAG: IS66 family transposase [Mesorhizobium sp.]